MRAMLAMLVLALPAAAQAADPIEGRRLAEQWCAACHRIGPQGPGPAADAVPSFAAIAALPGRTEATLSAFLRNPHGGMPDFGITLRQSQDLAAYIMAQRPR